MIQEAGKAGNQAEILESNGKALPFIGKASRPHFQAQQNSNPDQLRKAQLVQMSGEGRRIPPHCPALAPLDSSANQSSPSWL